MVEVRFGADAHVFIRLCCQSWSRLESAYAASHRVGSSHLDRRGDVVEVAGSRVVDADAVEAGLLDAVAVEGMWAANMEAAAGGLVDHARHSTIRVCGSQAWVSAPSKVESDFMGFD